MFAKSIRFDNHMNNPITSTKSKDKEYDIILLLFKFRHLTLKQFQKLLHLTSREYLRSFLYDLTNKKVVYQIFDTEVGSLPAVFCMSLKGIRSLRTHGIQENILKKYYGDRGHTKIFIDHCMFITSIYLSLIDLVKNNNMTLRFETATTLHYITSFIKPAPDAYFYIQKPNGQKKRYCIEVLDNHLVTIVKRVYQYIAFFETNGWQEITQMQLPDIIFICTDEYSKIKINNILKSRITDASPNYFLTTKRQVQMNGLRQDMLEKLVLNT